jgi:hypothetical protein
MTIAQDIIQGIKPDYEFYIAQGNSLDDIDEFGFTPLIETVICKRIEITKDLLSQGVELDKPDVTGRTALYWAVDNQNLEMVKLLLTSGSDPNKYTKAGMPILVYPILRENHELKNLLYRHGAKIDFALDFINAKLLGHRFELKGDVDIVNGYDEFIELDYEGFILEFTVAITTDSLRRFTNSYATKEYRNTFPIIHRIMDGYNNASRLLRFQQYPELTLEHRQQILKLINHEFLILPVASQGHAMCFVKYGNLFAKVDRGANSLKEGSVNIYKINNSSGFDINFMMNFLYKKQTRTFFHRQINRILNLEHLEVIPLESQKVGNCSWANMQAGVMVAYALLQNAGSNRFDITNANKIYRIWVEWDKDRALNYVIQRFYSVNKARQASTVSILAAVLFQSLDDDNFIDLKRAESIMPIITNPTYRYVLDSYLEIYCRKKLTIHGNNLLKLLEDCGVNANIEAHPVARSLKKKLNGKY